MRSTGNRRRLGALLVAFAAVGLFGCASETKPTNVPATTQTSADVPETSVTTPESPTPTASGSDTASTSQTPADSPSSVNSFTIHGTNSYQTPSGYTFDLTVNWGAQYAVVDVGSNPPGQTGVVIPNEPYSGVFTNTTAGDRALPAAEYPQFELLGIYSLDSAVCKLAQEPDGQGLGWQGGFQKNSGSCAIRLIRVMGSPVSGGAFDTPSIANATPIDFTADDMAFSAATDNRIRWDKISESTATHFVAALNKPLGFGLLGPKSTSAQNCVYPNEVSGDPMYVSVLASSVGDKIASCNGSVDTKPTSNTLTVYYRSSYNAAYIHYQVGTGAWTPKPGKAMTAMSCTGWYQTSIKTNGEQVTAVFNNGANTWDNPNNKGVGDNYHLGASGVVVVEAKNAATGTNPCPAG